ncbi:formate dehydrogenase accessory sulfurtransferase FdhD [Polynucleobacter sp. es-EL-1]|jgi:FdhD protein|uniref:formate dehydrogenase accessory sulfurtransferase FdhD n=1 Tax=Polynucleobacter sp. es-EL-1 TaxID=1855652 RepID=UPI000BC6EB19|nr:formate dehydrogenase accessory sulfurtransferase FdhD [Polynucleobacter sp. es-EL-1]OYZ34797.1 MAG: sulfurtransferase FdhD [Polynucleobacter sp. 16-46-70]QWE11012.1 formate dehydrogenase accessory sulfurtransferase FdhD [Polynucleobacter sp. es-EL-1]HQT20032.1 formate dehydrogenase accessory sulfurtransferase FdhD [Polynucleobacter sp.]HQT42104.1 formate dehydrogenase accessory sulfurtransferase FdhD [Polynucleobacter sp.]
MASSHNIEMSNASVPLVHEVQIMDEAGRLKTTHIPGERPLTIYLDKREVVTLMTLGSAPEALVLGYLRNQRLVESPEDIASIQVDWETDSAAVKTHRSTVDIDALTSKRVVTTGCGQGTMFGGLIEEMSEIRLPDGPNLSQEAIVALIDDIRTHDTIYKKSGSVHACAVFERQGESGIRLLHFIEDVGRHNAVDSISGLMWLADKEGKDLIFFTTGRLTSEMVIKGAQMGIPFLLTRSGVTLMGLELARKTNLTLLSRCSGKHFEIYNAPERVVFTSPASTA